MFRKFQQAPVGASPGLQQHASSISQQGDEHMPKIALLSKLRKMSYVFSLHSQGKRNRDMETPFGEFLSFVTFWVQLENRGVVTKRKKM